MANVKPYRRRSGRIVRRFPVVMRWKDPGGNFHEELAETVLVSRYGGLLRCSFRLNAGEDAVLWWPVRQREAPVRIVLCEAGLAEAQAGLAFEFLDREDFWGIEFPLDPLRGVPVGDGRKGKSHV